MLNWIIWNKTVLTLTLCIAKFTGAVEYTDCTSECAGYDTKQSNGEVPVMLSTPSLLLFPSPCWPGVLAPDRALSMG